MKNIFRWLEQKLFTGEILRDYGVLDEKQLGIARTRTSLLLCRRRKSVQLVFRSSAVAPLCASVNYAYVQATPEALGRLAEAVLDAKRVLERSAANHTSDGIVANRAEPSR